MAEGNSLIRGSTTAGDAAVDGLFGGLVAGILMAIFLILAGLLSGTGPGAMLGRFDPASGASPMIGTVLHLAVSGVYGLVFGMLHLVIGGRVAGWLAGLVYGLALFAIARGLLLPASGAALMDIPFWQFGAAHVVYGLALGATTGRRGG